MTMAHRTLHVAAAQIISAGPVGETLKRVERQAACAAVAGAEVILFAEGALHGYDYDLTPESVGAAAEMADGTNCRKISRMAKKHGLAILIGFFEKDGDAVYNSVLVARPDGSRAVERKHALTPGELAAGLTPGRRERTVFTFNGVRCAIIICADGGIESLDDDLRAQKVDYRFCPTGGGGKISDMIHAVDLGNPELKSRYEEMRSKTFNTSAILDEKECRICGFTSANALGPAGKQTCHQGHCMIVDNNRVMRAQIPGTIILEHMQDQMIHSVLEFG